MNAEVRLAEAWREHRAHRGARALLNVVNVEDQFTATVCSQRGVTVMTICEAKGKEYVEVIVYESPYQRYQHPGGADVERSARFNLHVAATRASNQ